MANIATARVEPHERAKNEDFEYGFQSIIRNTAILDRLLTSGTDFIAGGKVNIVRGTMTITIDPIWANGKELDLPAFQDYLSSPLVVSVPESYPRFSIVQIRGKLESFDKQRRSFFDPELEAAQYFDIDTKNRLVPEIVIKNGIEGVTHAPDTDPGYVKIAEIYVEPETTELTDENIFNVIAEYQGSENSSWTAEKNRTIRIGSISDVWAAFDKEHYSNGKHRESVIKASNILRGIATDALTSAGISVGENINAGDLSVLAAKTLLETLSTIGHILQGGTANTLLKTLSMLISWKDNETYQPYMPTFFQGRVFYANPLNLPMKGESPGNAPSKWINSAGDVPYLPPTDGRLYGMQNRLWTELTFGGEAIQALKFYSKKTLMLTNARIVDRRLRGWDLGKTFFSKSHEVYHFDTDLNNQNQENNITFNYEGEAPSLKGTEDNAGDLSFEPAVSDIVPFEMMGKSLFGEFSLSGSVPPQSSSIEFWMRIYAKESTVLLRLGSQEQDLVLLNLGGADPVYAIALAGDIPYSHPDEYGVAYNEARTLGNTLYHDWGEGTESIDLDSAGVVLNQGTWIHFAFVLNSINILIFIGEKQLTFARHRPIANPLSFVLNEEMNQFNIDELSIINDVEIEFNDFAANTVNRIPYAALDYQQKYAVIMVDDPEKLRTNIFESPQFKDAVKAIIAET